MKIRIKLTLKFLLIGILISLASFTIIYLLSSRHRINSAEQRMENRALTYAGLLLDERIVDQATLHQIDRLTKKLLKDEEIRIYDADRKIIFKNSSDTSAIDKDLCAKLDSGQKLSLASGHKEGIAFSYSSQGAIYYITAMAYDEFGKTWMSNLESVLLLSFIASVLLLLFAGYYYAGRALSPITSIVNQVNSINAAKLDSRLTAPNINDELGQLTATFNNLLARIQSAFDIQKNFVSNASHELRTPLTNLTSEIEVALIRPRTVERYTAVLKSLLVDIKKLNKLANGLLNLMHVEVAAYTFAFARVRIDELLNFTKFEVINQNEDYHVQIEFTKIPDEESRLIINGNENLLRIAFSNVIDNACKFASDHIAGIILSNEPDAIVIKIKDNGIGISPDDISKIWQPFYRAENARRYGGHGIGLQLARKIIELHKGTINIDSRLNMGTVVTISLPYSAV